MATVTPTSISKPWLVPGAAFTVKKNDCSIKCCFSRKASKQTPPSSTQRLVLPLSTSLKLFPTHGRQFVLHPHRSRATTGTDVVAAVEGQDSPPVAETDANDNKSDDSAAPVAAATTTTSQTRGGTTARPGRKSEMPAVKNEELVAGATFTGKVRAIQPFGAFIDFGAFTDGLVHVSQLSDTFVKDVASVVTIGQEVKVRLVEADIESKRISLTMRSNDDPPKRQSGGGGGDNKPRPGGKRNASKGGGGKKEDGFSSKYVKGQMLDGTVKNLTRSGAFITIGEGEEGFLPTNEEADDGIGSMMMGGGSSLQAGQEVKVRVLRIARGRVTLTMKEEDDGKFDETLSQGVVHTATNPFVLAFRKNEEIAAFLDKREEEAEKPVEAVKESEEAEASVTSEKAEETSEEVLSSETPKVEQEEVTETKAEDDSQETEEQTETVAAVTEVEEVEKVEETPELPPVPETKSEEEVSENSIPQSSATDEVSPSEAVASEVVEKKEEVVAEVPVAETVPDEVSSSEAVVSEDVEKKEEVVAEVPVSETVPDEVSPSEAVASEDAEKKEEVVAEVPVAEAETPSPVVTEASSEESVKAGISPALVKQLREETGAGMMDCKNALLESEGDMVKAQEYLRKKGLASADKKASRATAEGRIGSYIHDSRIGVLLEVNCETDFVSRGDIFKELVDDLAMQVAACPQVEYLVPEDVSEEIVKKEKEIEMQKEDLLSKPEQIREKIVEGRIKKRVDALALLEQPYIKDDKVIVKDLVKQRIATIGENIKVKRFIRYTLGEGLEKKSQDFAAEVAAQTAAKPKAEPEKEQPKAEEPKEAVPSPPTAVVSAGLVKQLREETGAGMMDCKKALAETGGDLEKAQEYLRKKGLSTADKKSSRLAAEGRIGSYIHDARIGVLIEVNCETDFVGRSEKFKELVDDLAMQAVANPQVQYVSIEDIPEEIKQKEKEIEMQREDLESKPDNIKEKIVEGRISKRLGEMALLEQPFIKDDSVLVKDLVKQTVATLGENIKVRRFVKFTLGEDN
ncbi:Polyprotein of EF-Ts [Hirschfeldia incana]|nr:Polyprotein of EF-Ts [Hirschfeldia incana]